MEEHNVHFSQFKRNMLRCYNIVHHFIVIDYQTVVLFDTYSAKQAVGDYNAFVVYYTTWTTAFFM